MLFFLSALTFVSVLLFFCLSFCLSFFLSFFFPFCFFIDFFEYGIFYFLTYHSCTIIQVETPLSYVFNQNRCYVQVFYRLLSSNYLVKIIVDKQVSLYPCSRRPMLYLLQPLSVIIFLYSCHCFAFVPDSFREGWI